MSIMHLMYVQIGSYVGMEDWVFALLMIVWTVMVVFAGYFIGTYMSKPGK